MIVSGAIITRRPQYYGCSLAVLNKMVKPSSISRFHTSVSSDVITSNLT